MVLQLYMEHLAKRLKTNILYREVRRLLKLLDPRGVEMRRHRLNRRQYISKVYFQINRYQNKLEHVIISDLEHAGHTSHVLVCSRLCLPLVYTELEA